MLACAAAKLPFLLAACLRRPCQAANYSKGELRTTPILLLVSLLAICKSFLFRAGDSAYLSSQQGSHKRNKALVNGLLFLPGRGNAISFKFNYDMAVIRRIPSSSSNNMVALLIRRACDPENYQGVD